jgi:hypothetical protein
VGKLTSSQLRTIVLCFVMREAAWELRSWTWKAFNEYMDWMVMPFLEGMSPTNVDLERIVYLGCGEMNSELPTLDRIWARKLGKVLPREALEPSASARRGGDRPSRIGHGRKADHTVGKPSPGSVKTHEVGCGDRRDNLRAAGWPGVSAGHMDP